MKKITPVLNHVKPFSSIYEMLEMAAAENGDSVAIKYKSDNDVKEVTFSEFRADTVNLGTALLLRGFNASHIGCIGENSYNYLVAYLSVLQSCGVFVPVDKELPEGDMANVLDCADCEVLFFSGSAEEKIKNTLDRLGKIKLFVCLDESSGLDFAVPFADMLSEGKEAFEDGMQDYLTLRSDLENLKLLVYTSGTTSAPKGVMLSEKNLVSLVYYGLQLGVVHTCCLSVLPYHHTYAAVAEILVSLHNRSTICINDKIRNVLKNLQLFKPDYIYLVPAFVESFYKKIQAELERKGKATIVRAAIASSKALRALGVDKRKEIFGEIHAQFGGNLKKIVCGGAPIRAEIGDFFNSIGIPLVNGYGITECSPLISVNVEDFNDPSTVGFPLPCIDVRIDNPTPDGIGEICVKGDTVMLGYYKNPSLTESVIIDGYFHTGDYGMINRYGQLVITGRKKNLIVLSNGKNIFPEEIEGYITGIPYILECIVRSGINENGEEDSLIAEIFLDENFKKDFDNTELENRVKKDISSVCRPLPSYKQIRKIIIRSEPFEKTASNKIKR